MQCPFLRALHGFSVPKKDDERSAFCFGIEKRR